MIIAAVAAAAGVLGCVLAVLLLWKKKLSKTWGISLLACALVIAGAGGIGVVDRFRTRQRNTETFIWPCAIWSEGRQTLPHCI